MKCRNCGYTFHGVICPLCGKKNIGVKRCSLCGEVISLGQNRCIHCGNPTPEQRDVLDTQVTYTSEKQSLENSTYTFEKGYDYKKNAYEFKGNTNKLYKQHNIKFPAIQITAIILFSITIIGIFSISGKDNTPEYHKPDDIVESIDEGNVDISTLSIQGDITSLQRQCNLVNLQVLDMQGEDIYFNDFNLYMTNHNFIYFDDVQGIKVDANFYVDGELIYYVDWTDGICVRNNGIKTVLIENALNLQKVNRGLYYQDDDNRLYHYDIDTKTHTQIGRNIYYYFVDISSQKIYVRDFDNKIKQMELDGTQEKELGIEAEMFIIDGSTIYVKQRENDNRVSLRAYDLNSKSYVINQQATHIEGIARYENSFIFSDTSGRLYRVFDNNDENQLLFDMGKEIYSFQLIGNKMIVGVLDENYNLYWYLVDYNGNYARIITS